MRYEIVQKLGRGAYGIVWKAIDKKTREALRWWDFLGLLLLRCCRFPSLEDFFFLGMFFVPKEKVSKFGLKSSNGINYPSAMSNGSKSSCG